MSDDEATLDWSTATVAGGRLTVPVAGEVPRGWATRVRDVLERLEKTSAGWGRIKVTRKEIRVDAVTEDAADDLHHLLESAVLQASASLRDPEEAERRSEEDERLTAAYRALAD